MANYNSLSGAFKKVKGEKKVVRLPTDKVVSRENPRTRFQGIPELADTILREGQLQPIFVSFPDNDGLHVIKHGERRWRACKHAGIDVEAILVRDTDDASEWVRKIIENDQREALSPMEYAHAFQRLTDEYGMTNKQVAEAIGRSPVFVSKALSLMRLPAEAESLITDEIVLDLDTLHILATMHREGPEACQAACEEARARGLSRARAAHLLKELKMANSRAEASASQASDLSEAQPEAPQKEEKQPQPQEAKETQTPKASHPEADKSHDDEAATNGKGTAALWRDVPTEALVIQITVPLEGKHSAGQLLTGRADHDPAYAWVQLEDDKEPRRVAARHVVITAVEASTHD